MYFKVAQTTWEKRNRKVLQEQQVSGKTNMKKALWNLKKTKQIKKKKKQSRTYRGQIVDFLWESC